MPFYCKKDYFEKHEKKYDYYSDEDLSAIKKYLPSFSPDGNVLDLACGSGVIGAYFQSQFPDITVFGADICLPLLKWASFNKCQSDACYLPYRNNSFDCIIAVAAFHHFPDIGIGIKECIRCLKPKGVFLAYEPNKFHLQRFVMMTDPLRHIFYKNGDHAISPTHFKNLLKKNGFTNINFNYVALKGTTEKLLSTLNHKVLLGFRNLKLRPFIPAVAPWFVISAIKT